MYEKIDIEMEADLIKDLFLEFQTLSMVHHTMINQFFGISYDPINKEIISVHKFRPYDLYKLMKSISLTFEERLIIAKKIIIGLQYLHTRSE